MSASKICLNKRKTFLISRKALAEKEWDVGATTNKYAAKKSSTPIQFRKSVENCDSMALSPNHVFLLV